MDDGFGWVIFCFVAPFAYCLFSLVSRRFFPWPKWGLPWDMSPATRSLLQVPAGVALLIYGLMTVPGDAREAGAYVTDEVCREGTHALANRSGSPCFVEDARVSATYWYRRHGTDYYLVIHDANGGQRRVEIDSYRQDMAVWNATRAAGAVPAKVQLVNGRPALIETAAGVATTVERPSRRLSGQECVAAFGAALAAAGLLEMLVASFLLPRGW